MTSKDPGNDFWALITPRTGEISAVRNADRGYSSDVTAIIDCAAGQFFIKAVREPSYHALSFSREAQVNPYVRPVSPALRWQLHENNWIVLAFDVIHGQHADFSPGSPDIPAVAGAVRAIGEIACPDIARDWSEGRWNRFTDSPDLFAGDSLLYTDINPDNFLITPAGASVVDWAWPTRGAGFIDPACLVIQLIAAGHTSEDAESWARHCPAWNSADANAVSAFAAATLRMYQYFENRDPAPWRKEMTKAVAIWAAYRQIEA